MLLSLLLLNEIVKRRGDVSQSAAVELQLHHSSPPLGLPSCGAGVVATARLLDTAMHQAVATRLLTRHAHVIRGSVVVLCPLSAEALQWSLGSVDPLYELGALHVLALHSTASRESHSSNKFGVASSDAAPAHEVGGATDPVSGYSVAAEGDVLGGIHMHCTKVVILVGTYGVPRTMKRSGTTCKGRR